MVSAGCTNCYAMMLMLTRLFPIIRKAYKLAGFADWETRPVWGDKAPRVLSKGFWNDARRINAQHAKAGKRGRWFPSMIDWLDLCSAGIIDQNGKKLDAIAVLSDLLKLIHDTPNLDWLLLTKRPDNWHDRIAEAITVVTGQGRSDVQDWLCKWGMGEPPSNIWIGVSCEDQQRADERIPKLLKIPAKIRFLSCEPLLNRIDFDPHRIGAGWRSGENYQQPQISWIIAGGESGPGARPCNIEWIRSIIAQCKAAGVACFVKQLGSRPVYDEWQTKTTDPIPLKDKKGGDMAEWSEDLRIREMPK